MTKPLYGLEQSWEWSWWCLGSSESRALHTRPAPFYKIETFLFMNPTASHFFFWLQGLPWKYLSCWSFREGLMPRLSSVLTTSTWVSIVNSLRVSTFNNERITAKNFISLPQWSNLWDFVWRNASKQRWLICQTPCHVQTNKQLWLSKTLPQSTVKHAEKRTKLKLLSNTLPCPNTKSDYQTPCHRAQPHAEPFLELFVRWCRVRLAAAPQPPWGIDSEIWIWRQRTS